jgi:hypothetical protein
MINMVILVIGEKIKKMDVVHIFIPTGKDIKEVGLKIRRKEKEAIDIEI